MSGKTIDLNAVCKIMGSCSIVAFFACVIWNSFGGKGRVTTGGKAIAQARRLRYRTALQARRLRYEKPLT